MVKARVLLVVLAVAALMVAATSSAFAFKGQTSCAGGAPGFAGAFGVPGPSDGWGQGVVKPNANAGQMSGAVATAHALFCESK